MLIFILALVSTALATRSGFHNSGAMEWRDCGVGNKWVEVSMFDITPSPIMLPGSMNVTLRSQITHDLLNTVSMDVLVEKELLGKFTRIPCKFNVGTCHYSDPCHFLKTFESRGSCPPQLTANGLPCTCPFNPAKLELPGAQFTVKGIGQGWLFLASGNFHVKIELHDSSSKQLRACLEFYMTLSV